MILAFLAGFFRFRRFLGRFLLFSLRIFILIYFKFFRNFNFFVEFVAARPFRGKLVSMPCSSSCAEMQTHSRVLGRGLGWAAAACVQFLRSDPSLARGVRVIGSSCAGRLL